MKFKKYILYILYVILICILVLFINWCTYLSKDYFKTTFEINILYSIILGFAAILLGVLLSIEYLIKQFKMDGTWKVNVVKLIFVVLPLLFLSFSLNIYYLNIFPGLCNTLLKLNLSIPSYLIFGIFCGYNFATSFYKVKSVNNKSIQL